MSTGRGFVRVSHWRWRTSVQALPTDTKHLCLADYGDFEVLLGAELCALFQRCFYLGLQGCDVLTGDRGGQEEGEGVLGIQEAGGDGLLHGRVAACCNQLLGAHLRQNLLGRDGVQDGWVNLTVPRFNLHENLGETSPGDEENQHA